jgi:hypothetical protein
MSDQHDLERAPPATEAQLEAAQRDLGVTLPGDYLDFLRESNGAQGFLRDSPVQLWAADELAEYNREHPDYGDGLVLIGSDGCGNALALNLSGTPTTVEVFPWIGGREPGVTEIYAGGFTELLGDYGRWFRE